MHRLTVLAHPHPFAVLTDYQPPSASPYPAGLCPAFRAAGITTKALVLDWNWNWNKWAEWGAPNQQRSTA
ncbi:hypothetical protein M8C13_03115 [Crossiella sp. SN42]|uniref:hypothetical protein n=1 Tax=Crossiella sp. SN42 TaxID=2944808 RepID=UPI00207C7337|nr:hypothetical protein [Crossiella sp. SN42]MCO1574748.1 hypothetical protein [Crossiella sp. SN42]